MFLTAPKAIGSKALEQPLEQLALPTGLEDAAPELTDKELQFLYNVEALRMPITRAGELAGVKSPLYLIKKPHMVAARAKMCDAVRGNVDFSREDVAAGFKEAIDQAKVLADPMAQIAGWREIAKLKGYDKIPSVVVNVHASMEQFKKELQHLPTEELLKIAGADIIDADFYQVEPHADSE